MKASAVVIGILWVGLSYALIAVAWLGVCSPAFSHAIRGQLDRHDENGKLYNARSHDHFRMDVLHRHPSAWYWHTHPQAEFIRIKTGVYKGTNVTVPIDDTELFDTSDIKDHSSGNIILRPDLDERDRKKEESAMPESPATPNVRLPQPESTPEVESQPKPRRNDTLTRHDTFGIDNCVPIADAYNEYTVDLESEYVRVAIPHGAIGISGCGIEFENISDFVDVFPDHIFYVYGVGIDQFSYGVDTPDILLESYPNEDKELYDGFGFLGKLKKDLMFTWSVEPMEVSVDLTIREGYTAYGIPIQSDDLATLGDFFDLFSGISYIYIYIDGKGVSVWRNTEMHHDILVEGWRSYLIRSRREETVTLTGQTWRDPTAAAPHIQHYHKMALTWGAVKTGLVKDIKQLR